MLVLLHIINEWIIVHWLLVTVEQRLIVVDARKKNKAGKEDIFVHQL